MHLIDQYNNSVGAEIDKELLLSSLDQPSTDKPPEEPSSISESN